MKKETEEQQVLILVPAAGYGRRVGSPASKEMLSFAGCDRLIDRALARCQELGPSVNVHVITREEKTELIQHLSTWKDRLNLHVQIIEPTRDWPETVLASKNYWREWNVLLLPDIEFEPRTALRELVAKLGREKKHSVAAAVHQVSENHGAWGFINPRGDQIEVAEKPRVKKSDWAWGLYAFHKSIGEDLLSAQMDAFLSGGWRSVSASAFFVKLTDFKDLTRPQ